ncbi:hypothetical protein OBV_10960 [Oscillibacter valericigenes Sjm18-20]|nr:hypothetical protein OBV_10960 [Oscillibacter valericigenes Sjm18-20]
MGTTPRSEVQVAYSQLYPYEKITLALHQSPSHQADSYAGDCKNKNTHRIPSLI